MKKSLMAILATVIIIIPVFLQADDEHKDGTQAYTLDTVFVTATKTEEKRKDIPNSVIYKDEIDIQEDPADGVGPLFSNELGLDWRTYGNYGGAAQTINIRGMSANGTQVLVNGISVNSPSLGEADVGKIPLNSIERIEVVKGSGSVLYGSGAMGGVINIITKSPKRDHMSLKASAGYGTQDTYLVSAEQGMFVLDDVGYYLTANRKETNGFRDNSDLEQNDVSMKLVLDKGDLLDISLYGDYIYRTYGVPGVRPPHGTDTFWFDGKKVYNEEAGTLLDRGSDKDGHIGLSFKSKPLDWMGFFLQTDYMDLRNYLYRRYYSPPFMMTPASLPGSKTWVNNKVGHVEGYLEFTPVEGASILAGADYKEYNYEYTTYNLDTDGDKVNGTTLKADEDTYTNSFYSEIQYRPIKYFKILTGVRYENHSAFGDETLPRFGLVFNPFENTVLKASHGKHFKAPTNNDLYWPDDGYTRGNPDLDPEIGWHSDVTVEQTLFDDKLFLTCSYFHWDIDDKIQWGPNPDGIFTPENLRQYEADGVEIGSRIGPFYNVDLGLFYTYTHATEESKDYSVYDYGFPPFIPANFQYSWDKRRAAYTPRDQFKANLTYHTDFGLTVSLVERFVGNRIFYRTEYTVYPNSKTVKYTLDKYWTTDIKIQQRLYKHWLLSLEINNIFDKGYGTYFGTWYDNTGATNVNEHPGEGRSIFGKVTYEF